MKRLVCRKCGSSFFKFRQADSSVRCNKCKCMVQMDGYIEKNNSKVENISISWKNVVS